MILSNVGKFNKMASSSKITHEQIGLPIIRLIKHQLLFIGQMFSSNKPLLIGMSPSFLSFEYHLNLAHQIIVNIKSYDWIRVIIPMHELVFALPPPQIHKDIPLFI